MLRNALLATTLAAALVAVSVGSAKADTNLITNGDFATGDLTGWTLTPAGANIGIDSSAPNSDAGNSYDAVFGPPHGPNVNETLSQNIATVPGTSYNLAFSAFDEGGPNPSESFGVTFGNFSTTITGDQAFDPIDNPLSGYADFAFVIPGSAVTASTTALSFGILSSSDNWNLDGVSMTAGAAPPTPVPEPASLALFATALGFGFFAIRRRAV